jgi:phosphoribosylglycinamide formyltransferase-1
VSFVSEPIKPVTATADTRAMVTGAPGLPSEFTWRDKPLRIAAVVRTWKETGPCKHGSSEAYVRRHWFEVQTDDNQVARIYFDRQPRDHNRTKRWWLYSIKPGD